MIIQKITAGLLLSLLISNFSEASISGGLFEAEDAAITSGGIKTHAGASGGLYVDGNGNFNLTWMPDMEGGDVELAFGIKVPNNIRTMGVFVNGVQFGVVSTSSKAWIEVSVEATMIAGINTLELRDSEGTAELDVDYVFISPKTTFNYQVEDMVLGLNYVVVSNAAAVNGQCVQTGATGTATRVFSGYAGEYYIDTYYFDETDGIGSYELRIDGVLVDAWLADSTSGTSGPDAASLTSHRTSGVQMQTNSVIELLGTRDVGEFGRADEMTFTLIESQLSEAENMVLDGYGIETNSSASGGQLVRLDGDKGSVSTTLVGLTSGYYDLTIAYFDETDGEAVFKVYINDQLVDTWLADRMLASSEADSVNRLERTTKNLYLRTGDQLEICGFRDGGEDCRIDSYDLQTADISSGVSMDWNSDGSIASLILNGSEHLDTAEASGVELRIFDGYSVDTRGQDAGTQDGALLVVHDNEFDYVRFYFRMDSYDHHLMLRLVGFDGIPQNDPSLNIRLEIPFLSTLGYQLMDASATARTVGGDLLEIDWPFLSSRNLLAGGQIALYATSDSAAALAEIEQVHTDNGNLDDYYAWIEGFPIIGTDADLFADPDFDGLNNLTEYALGGVPNLGNDSVLPTIGNTGSDVEVNYNRRLDAEARGLTYMLVKTDDLVNPAWSTNGLEETGSLDLGDDFESVINSVETVGTTNGFIRLDIGIEK